jgi:hypothetical protein
VLSLGGYADVFLRNTLASWRRPPELPPSWGPAPAAPSTRPRSPPYVRRRQPSQPLAARGLPGQQERARKLAGPAQFECFRNPCTSRHPARRDLRNFHSANSNKILLRDLPLFCPFAQSATTSPCGSRSHWILGIRQMSTAEYQRPEFIDQSGPPHPDRRWQDSPSVFLKKSRLRSSWLSSPMRTSAAIALLMLVSTVWAYRAT